MELLITGYTSYTDLTGRDVALYLKDSLLSKALKPTILFESFVWCSIPLINSDILLVGVSIVHPAQLVINVFS